MLGKAPNAASLLHFSHPHFARFMYGQHFCAVIYFSTSPTPPNNPPTSPSAILSMHLRFPLNYIQFQFSYIAWCSICIHLRLQSFAKYFRDALHFGRAAIRRNEDSRKRMNAIKYMVPHIIWHGKPRTYVKQIFAISKSSLGWKLFLVAQLFNRKTCPSMQCSPQLIVVIFIPKHLLFLILKSFQVQGTSSNHQN